MSSSKMNQRSRHVVDGWATYDDVGSHSVLLAVQDEDLVVAFRRALLGPLIEYDARHQSSLVETLDTFSAGVGAGKRPLAPFTFT